MNDLPKKFDLNDLCFEAPKSAATRREVTLALTLDAYIALRRLDELKIGTKDYMGLAPFWGVEFKHVMRETSYTERASVHDALIDAGLTLNGDTVEHGAVVLASILRIRGQGRHLFLSKGVRENEPERCYYA
jgi:hypothetical protein